MEASITCRIYDRRVLAVSSIFFKKIKNEKLSIKMNRWNERNTESDGPHCHRMINFIKMEIIHHSDSDSD